jgi:hypothetical protein
MSCKFCTQVDLTSLSSDVCLAMSYEQAAPAAPGQSSSVTQDNDEGRGHAMRAARHAARPPAQDLSRRHKGQAPSASPTQ